MKKIYASAILLVISITSVSLEVPQLRRILGPTYLKTAICWARIKKLEYPTQDQYAATNKSAQNGFIEGEIVIVPNLSSPTKYDYFCIQYVDYSPSHEIETIYLLGRTNRNVPKSERIKKSDIKLIGKLP